MIDGVISAEEFATKLEYNSKAYVGVMGESGGKPNLSKFQWYLVVWKRVRSNWNLVDQEEGGIEISLWNGPGPSCCISFLDPWESYRDLGVYLCPYGLSKNMEDILLWRIKATPRTLSWGVLTVGHRNLA